MAEQQASPGRIDGHAHYLPAAYRPEPSLEQDYATLHTNPLLHPADVRRVLRTNALALFPRLAVDAGRG